MQIMVIEGGSVEPGEFPEGYEELFVEPFSWECDEAAMLKVRRRPSVLPHSKEVKGPLILLTQQRHDGTLLFTQDAIAGVVAHAEHTAAARGGEWTTSEVRVLHRIAWGDMPYGKNRMHTQEIVSIAMREGRSND